MLAYALLTLALIALWVTPDWSVTWQRFLWLAFFVAAVVSALVSGIVAPLGLGWIVAFAALTALFACNRASPALRGTCAIAIITLAAGLMTHLLPGFHNVCVVPE